MKPACHIVVFWLILALLGLMGCSRPSGSTETAQQPAPPAPARDSTPAAAAQQPAQYPRRVQDRLILYECPAGAAANLRYELGVGSCAGSECPYEIRLAEADTVLGTARLDWPSATPEPEKKPVDLSWGAGDPLRVPADLTGWQSGEEEREVGTAARCMKLGPERNALLVTQIGGFEHVKRRHYLYAAPDRKLIRIWFGREEAGPTWSATELTGSGQERQILVHYSGFMQPSETEPEGLTINAWGWQPNTGKLGKEAPPVHIAALTGYANAAAARRARAAGGDCLSQFWVLPARQFPEVKAQGAVLAAAAADRRAVEDLLSAAGKCAPSAKALSFSLN